MAYEAVVVKAAPLTPIVGRAILPAALCQPHGHMTPLLAQQPPSLGWCRCSHRERDAICWRLPVRPLERGVVLM